MKLLISFMILAVVFVGGLGAVGLKLGYFQGPGQPITFTVQKGENFAGISKKLAAQGIISNERALRWYVNFLAPAKHLKRGEFALSTHMPVPELVSALTEGKPIEHKFTVPEGENIFQIGEALEAKGFVSKADFIAAASSPELIQSLPGLVPGRAHPKSIEGYLFPDTYMLQHVFSAKEIAHIMLAHYREIYKKLEAEFKESLVAREFQFDPHQIVTLASIVEKETGAASERPLVASIFVNRLRKRMRLQTDPTIIYGIYLRNGTWNGNIGRRELDTPGPYNSYTSEGLPPGPIANPGMSAIRAVLNPATSDYLFFMSKGDGTHAFSKDFASHNKVVQDMIAHPPSKEGKSWRNLAPSARAK